MIGAWLAYIFLVYLGAFAIQYSWVFIIHRTPQCDLSLACGGLEELREVFFYLSSRDSTIPPSRRPSTFQLGLRFLEHCLNEDIKIPTQFHRLE